MPSCPKSTSVPEAQQHLADAAEELRCLDDRLSTLAAAIAPDAETILPARLRAGIDVVRQDLLSDAIETLAGLATLTEDAAVQRQAEIADVLAWLSAAA